MKNNIKCGHKTNNFFNENLYKLGLIKNLIKVRILQRKAY